MVRFLDPNSGLIAAAVAVPVLLLLYFLRLRRKTLRVSSTLLWEQAFADLQVNVPFRWLRVSALLVLQLLALGALVAALARPAIPGQAPVADRVVLIIDHSASMSARDAEPAPGNAADAQPRTRLEVAKQRAIEIVRELDRSAGTGAATRPTVSVIASAATARIVQPPTTSSADVIDAINSIEPTDLPGGLGPALELLASTRAAAAGDESGAARATGREQVIGVTDEAVSGPLRVVRVAPSGTPSADNLGIVALGVRRDENAPDLVRVFVRIAGTAAAPVTTGVRVMLDGRTVASRSVRVGPEGAGETFEINSRDGGVVVVSLERADALEADNAAGAVIGPVASPSIVVVAPPGASGAAEADPFLMGLLESLSPRRLRVMTPEAHATDMETARRERARGLAGVDLVIFDRVEPAEPNMPEQPTISFGAGLPRPGLRLGAAREAGAGAAAVRFDTWKRTHPLMRYVSLDTIIVSPPPPPIEGVVAGAGTTEGPAAPITVLASGPDGPLIVAEEEPVAPARPRHVVVSFPLRRSNWATDASFAVFMTNAVDTMLGTGSAAEGAWFAAGAPIVVRPAAGATVVSARGPAELEARVDDPSAPVALGTPIRTGVYRLTGARQAAACVNLLSPEETSLGRGAGEPGQTPASATNPATAAEVGPARADRQSWREIWHLFILAAMVLASAEWLLFARASRL